MRDHIKVLGWLHIVLNGFHLLIGLLAFLFFSGLAGLFAAAGGHDALPAFAVLGGIASFVLLIFMVLAIPGMLVGWGLLQYAPWARIAAIVFSIIDLFSFPLGTALGVYGLITLFNPETIALFERPQHLTS